MVTRSLNLDTSADGHPPDDFSPSPDSPCPRVLDRTGFVVDLARDPALAALVLRDRRFSRRQVPKKASMTGNGCRSEDDMLNKDAPEVVIDHHIITPWFKAPAFEAQREAIEDIIARATAGLAPGCHDLGPWCRQITAELATFLLGVPLSDWDQRISRWLGITTDPVFPSEAAWQQNADDWGDLYAYMAALVKTKKDQRDGSVLSGMIVALYDAGYDDDQVMHVCATVLTGTFTPLDVLEALAVVLLDRRRWRLRRFLRRHPEQMAAAVMEGQRAEAHFVAANERVALEDVRLADGRLIRAGTVIIVSYRSILWGLAGRPRKFDMRQKADRATVYGAGPHYCPAAWWATTVMAMAFRSLIDARARMAVPRRRLAWTNSGLLPVPLTLPVITGRWWQRLLARTHHRPGRYDR